MHRAEMSLETPKMISFFIEELCACFRSLGVTRSRRIGNGGRCFDADPNSPAAYRDATRACRDHADGSELG